ncbi:MAG: Ig-like domain-containing protein [Lachnospiraceae bacterium]|nr:Ig-like domain-containing protein [Lachnospiraceae bacterium]
MLKDNYGKGSGGLVAFLTIFALALATLVIMVFAVFTKTDEENATRPYISENVASQRAQETLSIKIDMEDCTMLVGTQYVMTASVYPSGNSSALRWSTSNPEVLTVDPTGKVDVVGEGIGVVTASIGTTSDSIAIECVHSLGEATLNYPEYTTFLASGESTEGGDSKTSKENQGNLSAGAGTGEIGKENQETQAPIGNSSAQTKAAGETSAQNPTQAGNKTVAEGTKGATTPTNAQMPTQAPASNTTTPTVAPTAASTTTPTPAATKATTTTPTAQDASGSTTATTEGYTGVKITSNQEASKLASYGFQHYLDSTYVYEENDNYLGEVVVSGTMLHIYVKERSTGFDHAINSVLSDMLPESADSVWNSYTSATSDQTMTVDGRVVRFVMPSEGHSQIVLYN